MGLHNFDLHMHLDYSNKHILIFKNHSLSSNPSSPTTQMLKPFVTQTFKRYSIKIGHVIGHVQLNYQLFDDFKIFINI